MATDHVIEVCRKTLMPRLTVPRSRSVGPHSPSREPRTGRSPRTSTSTRPVAPAMSGIAHTGAKPSARPAAFQWIAIVSGRSGIQRTMRATAIAVRASGIHSPTTSEILRARATAGVMRAP